MDLGQRLKSARLELGLSQKALCGDTITRNMLSQIESGKARPSMETLRYLAGRLGKPMGYFLEEQAVLSPNQSVMEQARLALRQKQYRQALTVLEQYREDDPVFDSEKEVLTALCQLYLARQALSEGRTMYAVELLERMQKPSLYDFPGLERERCLLLGQAGLPVNLPADDRELMLRAKMMYDRQDHSRCVVLLRAAEKRDAQWNLLRGKVALALGDYGEAAQYFHCAEAEFPEETAPLLEQCYRELEDYKKAYDYALKRRSAGE